MRLSLRIHEWLADHVSWVQYPVIRPAADRHRLRRSVRPWNVLTWRQKGWRVFWLFWGAVLGLSIYGNLIR